MEVADFPHHDQQGRTATLRRLQQRAGFQQEDGATYDSQGRRVSRGYDDFMAWLGSHNIAAAA